MSKTLELTQELMACPSVTPDDAGCQDILTARLEAMGFDIEALRYGDTDNLWARRGTASPLFVFAGHTDVVPAGEDSDWDTDPFTPTIVDGYLYGRGAADMKSGLAAMIIACEEFLQQHPEHSGSIAFLITSDEEGTGKDGTIKVVEHLQKHSIKMDWCIVGEPTSSKAVGDIIKNGRRGSLSGTLKVKGTQGHIAYPHLCINTIHKALPALTELTKAHWDEGDDSFPPTSMQISNINAGTGADNVIPGHMDVLFNFRYSPASKAEDLMKAVHSSLDKEEINYDLDWHHSGKPFITPPGKLLDAVQSAVKSAADLTAALSTDGGTSDGRHIAPTGCHVIELGVCNDTIHAVNERVKVEELDTLKEIYKQILSRLLLN